MTLMTLPKRFELDVSDTIKDQLKDLVGSQTVTLASGSPRRREILRLAGIDCRVIVPHVDESVPNGVDPMKYAHDLAQTKLESIQSDDSLAVSADTIVVLNNEILDKPKNAEDAFGILRTLSGHRHYVRTALAIRNRDKSCVASDVTYVTFRELSDEAIRAYVDTGEPMDKAGAYGIQGMGELLVDKLEGSLHNVIGFPIELFVRMLREWRA